MLDRIVGGFGGPKQPVQSLDIGGRIEFLGLDQRPGDRQSPRMLLVVGLKRDLDGAEFEANRAFLGAVSSGEFQRLDAEHGGGADGLIDTVVRRSEVAFGLGDADDGSVRRIGDALEDFVDIAFAIEDMHQTRAFGDGQIVEGRFGRLDAVEPFRAFLEFDGSGLALAGDGRLMGRPTPEGLVQEAANDAVGLHGDGGVEVQSQRVGVVELAESLGVNQRRVVGGGGILNGEDGLLSAAKVQRGIDERLQAVLDLDARIFEEPIEGLGLAWFVASLRKGIERLVGEGFEDNAETSVESLVGKVGLRRDEGGPRLRGIRCGKMRSGHPWFSERPFHGCTENIVGLHAEKRQPPSPENCA